MSEQVLRSRSIVGLTQAKWTRSILNGEHAEVYPLGLSDQMPVSVSAIPKAFLAPPRLVPTTSVLPE